MKNKTSLLSVTDRAALQSGDVVFIAVRSPVYAMIARTAQSWDSHVGIIFREANGALVVAESRVPRCSYTTLDKFLARSASGQFAIRRLPAGLTAAQATALRAECDRRMGIQYHLGFDFDAPRQFCSKFVYETYRAALGIEVGRLETFRDLLTSNPAAPVNFWRLWFFGFIPWQRRTVTPTSQLRSPLLQTVLAKVAT
ncbi:MAG: hypothetical protein RLZZ350_2586 [Verrucomicrobiota bacterium]|jgi:hypothetical protein